ncbi:MAG: hypothetical protein IKZ07_07525 [Akkermansia sp.]|nr:hypothetical protein [Akkermansia sp.]
MQQHSPYLNPGWADAVWDVSGAFVNDRELIAFHDFCTLLLGFSPFNIVHGAPLCAWNSGRVLQHLMRTAEEIRAAGLEYEKRNIALYYTFTNLNLKEEHLSDPIGNAMLTFSANHNPTERNAVIMASDALLHHVKSNFPKLRTVSSILKITNSGGKGKLSAYQHLAEQYDEVMVHPDDVLNYELLEKLEEKERYILLVNEYCIRECPMRALHYSTLSKMALNYFSYDGSEFDKKQATNGCRSLGTLLTHPKHSVLALNTPEIAKLREMGFRHFKLQGRGHANASSILFDLLRLVMRNDAADENAMHAIGQRFWESILPRIPS